MKKFLAVMIALSACSRAESTQKTGNSPAPGLAAMMKARGLSEADVKAALATYTPSGKHDEYLVSASGGHSGQVVVIGVPNMRILKYIGVFTPEPWQGWGFDDASKAVLAEGRRAGKDLTWADTHHPALSETAGDYDGQYLFIADKANARVAVIDLKDFMTKQIVTSELIGSDHGGTFVTPNTEYVIESTQYPTPLGGSYADAKELKEKYRGAAIFWKFDRAKGRIDKDASFAIELPPYTQDLSDAGKLASDGYAFINSINTELSYGGNTEGNPPMESGYSQNDMDYLHVINWRKAEQLVAQGKFTNIAGMRVLPLATAAAENVLVFVPEPKSPHGVDVTPDGKDIVVGGKLDTHATVYSIDKIKVLVDKGQFATKDAYGVNVLDFKSAIRGQVELGLGPLHTQYDANGNAYTSLFLETSVAKWSLRDLKLIEKPPTHYNIGHLVTAEGDTVNPDGKYLIVNAVYGVLVERSRRVEVVGNHVCGDREAALGLRGDTVRLWETRDSVIERNLVEDGRDVVVWYSNGNRIANNRILRGRYGAHFMCSHDNVVRGNELRGGVVGVFAMYSRGLVLEDNLIADAAGAAGMGIGIKESGNVMIERNLLVHDAVGIYIDSSPLQLHDTLAIRHNVLRLDQVAFVFHSSGHRITIEDNDLADNDTQVRVDGGGTATDVDWRGNYFDDYAGYDLDDDGSGDVPYELRSVTAQLIGEHAALALFRGTPALGVVDAAAHLDPLFQPQLVLADPQPRMAPNLEVR